MDASVTDDASMNPDRHLLLGVPVDCLDRDEALARIDARIRGPRGRGPYFVIAVNPEKSMRARDDSALRSMMLEAGMLIPDGIGVVFALRLLTHCRIGSRVTGVGLMSALTARAPAEGYRIFLFGGRPGVNLRARQALEEKYPGIRIVGAEHGYHPESEQEAIVERINAAAPDLLFVALGSPRQELWMARHGKRLGVAVCQGIGGSLDVVSGEKRLAPDWAMRLNIEWLYRLVTEPRRLRRQMVLPRYALLLLLEWIRHRFAGRGVT